MTCEIENPNCSNTESLEIFIIFKQELQFFINSFIEHEREFINKTNSSSKIKFEFI